MLSVCNLTKKFGKKIVLDEVSLTLDRGVYGLLGPNGSGKTTLMRCVTGIYKYSGKIETPDNIGYLPQKFGAFRDLTVNEVLEYFSELKGIAQSEQKKHIEVCLESVHLSDRAKDKVKALSGGMMRRLGVAQAMLGNPPLVLVDEPTAGLDPEERLRFKSLISQNRECSTFLISTHIVEDVEALCDYIIIMQKGKVICQETPDNIRRAAEGAVYRILESEKEKISEPYYVLRSEQIDGEKYLRVLSRHAQCGIPVQPTLEDGYMHIIRGGK